MEEPQPDGKKSEIAVYEVTGYYCPYVPLKQCDKTAPGTRRRGGNRIEIVLAQLSSMNEYHQAFQNAHDGAPLCSVHNVQMVPQLQKMG